MLSEKRGRKKEKMPLRYTLGGDSVEAETSVIALRSEKNKPPLTPGAGVPWYFVGGSVSPKAENALHKDRGVSLIIE